MSDFSQFEMPIPANFSHMVNMDPITMQSEIYRLLALNLELTQALNSGLLLEQGGFSSDQLLAEKQKLAQEATYLNELSASQAPLLDKLGAWNSKLHDLVNQRQVDSSTTQQEVRLPERTPRSREVYSRTGEPISETAFDLTESGLNFVF